MGQETAPYINPQNPPMTSVAGAPDPQAYENYVRAVAAQQANTTGLTQVSPNLGGAQPPRQTPMQDVRQRGAEAFGPGQGGARQRQTMSNFVSSVQQASNQIAKYNNDKKQREYQQTIGQMMGAVKGINDAQAQMQQAQAILQKDPNNAQAKQLLQQAQSALQTNRANMNDLANNSKAHKIITKAFGIDDKNADSPERQAAIQMLQKQMGIGQSAASLMSRLPQTQQLTPQAEAQAMARSSNVMGKPATEGQILSAGNAHDRNTITAQNDAQKNQNTADANKIREQANLQKELGQLTDRGMKGIQNSDGNYQRNPDGTLVSSPLTTADLAGNPVLAAKFQLQQQKYKLMEAQTWSTKVRAQVAQQHEARLRSQASMAMQPGAIQNWAALVTDPKSGVTLAQVPAAARSAVVNSIAASGRPVSKPLTSDELKRSDLAGNAIDNISAAQAILKKRPDLFGPGGWGKSKFALAFSGGDPDAVSFMADITLANLPAVGIHGVRGKYAIEDLQKLDGNLYLNPASMANVLSDINRSATEFQSMGGRKSSTPASPTSSAPSSSKPANPDDPGGLF